MSEDIDDDDGDGCGFDDDDDDEDALPEFSLLVGIAFELLWTL